MGLLLNAQDKEELPPLPKIPNMPNIEQHTGEIKKVIFAMQGDARFIAYIVLWKGQEIVITDMFSEVPKEKGDKLKFISMTMKMPNVGNGGAPKSVLQFSAVPEIELPVRRKKE